MDYKELLFFLILTLLVIGIIIIATEDYKNHKKNDKSSTSEFSPDNYKQKNIVSINEYKFYKELKKYTDENNLILLVKPGLKEFFEVKDNSYFKTNFERISRKHVDFAVCTENMHPVYAIELDDKSHESDDAKKSDHIKNELFKSSKIQLIRVKAKFEYTEEQVEAIFTNSNLKSQNEEIEYTWI